MRQRFLTPASFAWIGLAVSLVAGAFGIIVILHRIEENERERLERETLAMGEARREEIEETVAQVVGEIEETLIGFHFDGLANQLEEWEDGSDLVLSTFVHQSRPVPEIDGAMSRLIFAPPNAGESYFVENLEQLLYQGAEVAPEVGWFPTPEAGSECWTCWHRLGPGGEVRGCVIDGQWITSRLQEAVRQFSEADYELTRSSDKSLISGSMGLNFADQPFLSGYRLILSNPESAPLSHRVQWLMRGTVFAILAIFLTSLLLLWRESRRTRREALRRSHFVSSVSHELRTPLTSIRLHAEMLNDRAWSAEKQQRFLATILRESERLTQLVEHVLDFSALERGSRKVHPRTIDLREILDQTLQAIGPQFAQAGLTVECAVPDAPLEVQADPHALGQALRNLLDNARKYAASGKRVIVSTETSPHSVLLRVRDFGPGLKPDARQRIFEPFVQGSDALTDKPAGVGLGLAIARAWLEAAGARLEWTSVDGPGACFTIHLPRSSSL